MQIFQKVVADETFQSWEGCLPFKVMTWSSEALGLFQDLRGVLGSIPKPSLVHLRGEVEYDYTYTLDLNSLSPHTAAKINELACSLRGCDPGPGLIFFTGLLGPTLGRNLIHVFLSALRSSIARVSGNEFAALYPPLGDTGRNAGEFRLHADLYRTAMLWNIFDDVPEDGTGASTFLGIPAFFHILDLCANMPEGISSRLKSLFLEDSSIDRYEEYMSLVYEEGNKWHHELWREMFTHQSVICFRRGDGYLMNDRKWLHGRDAPSRGVSRWRVHRLTFDPLSVLGI